MNNNELQDGKYQIYEHTLNGFEVGPSFIIKDKNIIFANRADALNADLIPSGLMSQSTKDLLIKLINGTSHYRIAVKPV